jgi:hypothetical protein
VKPVSPRAFVMAHAAARGPAGFEPAIVGFTTGYPGQAVVAKYWWRWRSRPRVSSTETPFGAYPYLCRSAERLVTPGTRKSQGGNWSGQNASANPPMQASTCNAIPRDAVIAATSAIGSRLANGYDGALSTTSATSSPRRASIASGVGAPVSGSTGTRSSASPK